MAKHEMKPITRQVLMKARQKYCNHYFTRPEQFNLKYSEIYGWEAEFCENKGAYSEGFLTCTGVYEEVLDLFWSCNADLLSFDWDQESNDDKQMRLDLNLIKKDMGLIGNCFLNGVGVNVFKLKNGNYWINLKSEENINHIGKEISSEFYLQNFANDEVEELEAAINFLYGE